MGVRRLRLLFLGFAISLIGPIGLLVQRSLQSIEMERQLREQTVAERVFDEMERNLSSLIEREENLPIAGYPEVESVQASSFIIRRFQIAAARSDPGAASASPRRPDTAAPDPTNASPRKQAADPGDFPLELPTADDTDSARSQAPGTTVRLDSAKGAKARAAKRTKIAELNEYDALRSLNKAVEQRLERWMPFKERGAGDELAAAAAPSAHLSMSVELEDQAFGKARMNAQAPDAGRLVLYRTVAIGSELYRQGILIDVARLGEWLMDRSIGGVPYASLEFFTSRSRADKAQTDNRHDAVYRHRFAPPFSDLTAHLRLRPLAERGSSLYVYLLSLALVAATLIGLALLYRMVAVTLRFAERRNNFVAAVSHELKTPLTAIRMYGEMLRDGVVPSENKRSEYYRHITNESERLSRLINNVLEYSKLEKGDRRLALETGSVAPVIHQVVETMGPHAEEHGFELVSHIAQNLPATRFETDALTQILWNLVDNAIKYASTAIDRRIELRAVREGDGVVISVGDHGGGVDERHLREVFEPFFRTENELTRASKGTGLGLALVKGLAEGMGATVVGTNSPKGGFVVEVRLPIATTQTEK